MDTTTKTASRKQALEAFREKPYISSTEVSGLTGMSRSTTHRAVEFLRGQNLLVVAGKGQSTDSGGKKPVLLGLNLTYRHILCYHIQVGGLTAGIADLKGRILVERALSFSPNSPLAPVLSHMDACRRGMADDLGLRDADFAGVGVGCDGVADTDSGILSSSPNYRSWGEDIPLKQLVEDMFDSPPPVYIDNSNRFGAYAEYRAGKARGVKNFLVLDGHKTGVGAGVVVGGELWRGRRRLAGEIGHMTVDPHSDRVCSCGARGCLETLTHMSYLEELARNGYEQNKKSLVFASDPSYSAVYQAANAGDAFACSIVDVQAGWLAVGINAAALLLDPDLIVLQGAFTEGGGYLLESVQRLAAGLGFPRIKDKAEIVHSSLGRERCLAGQAHYVADKFFSDTALYE